MDEDELTARLAGLRMVLTFALKATCENPAQVRSRVMELREIAGLIPDSVHPAAKDEIQAVIDAMTRLPVRDPLAPQTPTSRTSTLPPRRVGSVAEAAKDADNALGELL